MCEDCKYYEQKDSYKRTGYCLMWEMFVKANEYQCEDYEEGE